MRMCGAWGKARPDFDVETASRAVPREGSLDAIHPRRTSLRCFLPAAEPGLVSLLSLSLHVERNYINTQLLSSVAQGMLEVKRLATEL